MFGKPKEGASAPPAAATEQAPGALGSDAPSSGPRRVTPVDIQQKEFRLAFRGYNERDVDQFLDELTEEVARLHAENRRMREDLLSQGTVRLDSDGPAEANAILQRAREEAARLADEARAEAARIMEQARAGSEGMAAAIPPSQAAPAGHPAQPVMRAFLAREREFLQSLAGLIQGHAESVKEDIKRTRPQAPAGGGEGGAAAPTAGPPAWGSPDSAVSTSWPSERGDPATNRSGPRESEETQIWRPSFEDRPPGGAPEGQLTAHPAAAEPSVGTATAQDRSRWGGPSEPDDVIDLTETGSSSGSTEADGSTPAFPARSGSETGDPSVMEDEEDDQSDHSLRELFWGQD
jgi:DivIVA domain-containing protein